MNRGGIVMGNRPRILFVHINLSSFVEQDLNILRKKYEVIEYHYKKETSKYYFIKWFLQNRNRFDVCYVWFGDIHATIGVALSRLFRKKIVVVAGGYDTTFIQEIDYGFLRKPQRYLYAWFHFTFANLVITITDELANNILNKIKAVNRNIVTVLIGLDPNFWSLKEEKVGKNVISVAIADNMARAKLKGIPTILEIAKMLPNINFEIIGINEPALSELKSIAPSNITILHPLGKDDLIKHYRNAKVYLQLSLSEVISMAMCEAMLCNCIPIGTRIGGIPMVIGDTGYYVPYGDVKSTVDAIKVALELKNDNKTRERIISHFSLDIREKKILQLIDELNKGTKRFRL